jgi:hypothetical protein
LLSHPGSEHTIGKRTQQRDTGIVSESILWEACNVVLTMAQTDIAALRAYVTAEGNSGAHQADSTVLLHVTHSNLQAQFIEIRFDLSVRNFRCC